MPKRQRLGEYLVEKGLITEAQLREALEEQKQTAQQLGRILIKRGFISEEEITQTLANQLKIAYVDLNSYKLIPEIVKLITQEQAQKLLAIPIRKIGNVLEVAVEDPLNIHIADELRAATGLDIKAVFACPSVLKSIIEKTYQIKTIKPAAIESFVKEEGIDHILEDATQESVVKMVNQIIQEAVKLKASDIHLEPEEKTFLVRFRIDGVMHNIKELPKKQELIIISRLKIMADMDIAEKRLPQDGRIELKVLDKDIDLRVATFPTLYGENMSIRVLDKSAGLIKLENLGFDDKILTDIHKVVTKPQGIILVTGPTGSGKTTTLYAILNTINKADKNILTLEDPIEYVIPNIRQSQINVKAGLTFASGLRAMVRQDPDIIMIGEIRDHETAEIAIHSALTGHLVLATLHTNDASSAAMRLIDMGAEPFLVASTLTGIIAQRLVRRLCEKCKKPYSLSSEEIQDIKSSSAANVKLDTKHVFKEAGCSDCYNTGYKGRVGIFELLFPDEEIRKAIITKAGSQEIKQLACKKGMQTLFEDGIGKVSSGVTTLSEILRVAREE